jgi:hypothetical protein
MSFQVVKGVSVPQAGDLKQQFELHKLPSGQDHVIFNVSAERIYEVFSDFVRQIPEPGFFVLETPCNEVRELELRKCETDPFHRDVYYIDGLSRFDVLRIFDEHSDIFINDGMTRFGYGAHGSRDEVFVGGYKIFSLFCDSLGRYLPVFDLHKIENTTDLLTAWNTFTKAAPGVSLRWERSNGDDIYDVIEHLIRNHRMYLAKTI